MKPKDWWTETRVTLLKVRWDEGYWASQIAAELGTTRGAIIGKVHRLGLPQPKRHQPQSARKIRERARHRPVPNTPQPEAPRVIAPPILSLPVHIHDLERHHCRWIPGEPSSLLYCGKDRSKGSPYCSQHTRAAYNRPLSA